MDIWVICDEPCLTQNAMLRRVSRGGGRCSRLSFRAQVVTHGIRVEPRSEGFRLARGYDLGIRFGLDEVSRI